MFRRRTQAAPEAAPEVVRPGSKGRPTPKRRDAEKRNRKPITAPKDRKEAYRQVRERQRDQRAKSREGMARGDERYLPKRDQGPVRKLARDYVDSRRTIGSYLMYAMFAIVLFSFLPIVLARLLVLFAPPVLLATVLIEGFIISRRVNALAAERHPDANRKGVGLYAAMRAMQIRRLRLPKPRLQPGEQDQV